MTPLPPVEGVVEPESSEVPFLSASAASFSVAHTRVALLTASRMAFDGLKTTCILAVESFWSSAFSVHLDEMEGCMRPILPRSTILPCCSASAMVSMASPKMASTSEWWKVVLWAISVVRSSKATTPLEMAREMKPDFLVWAF